MHGPCWCCASPPCCPRALCAPQPTQRHVHRALLSAASAASAWPRQALRWKRWTHCTPCPRPNTLGGLLTHLQTALSSSEVCTPPCSPLQPRRQCTRGPCFPQLCPRGRGHSRSADLEHSVGHMFPTCAHVLEIASSLSLEYGIDDEWWRLLARCLCGTPCSCLVRSTRTRSGIKNSNLLQLGGETTTTF